MLSCAWPISPKSPPPVGAGLVPAPESSSARPCHLPITSTAVGAGLVPAHNRTARSPGYVILWDERGRTTRTSTYQCHQTGVYEWGDLMTKKTPDKRHRRSIRLKGYDYSLSGAYFVTICVQGGECLLGDVVEDEMRVNVAGVMVRNCWHALPERFNGVDTDAFVVMLNHIHGVILLSGDHDVGVDPPVEQDRAATRAAPTVGDIVGAYKSITTNE